MAIWHKNVHLLQKELPLRQQKEKQLKDAEVQENLQKKYQHTR